MNVPGWSYRILTRWERILGIREFSARIRFRLVYWGSLFGGGESRSGTGSSLAQTETVRQLLPGLLRRWEIRSLLDAPCGDCRWISHLSWGAVKYTVIDIVPEAIKANRRRFCERGMSFVVGDICRDPLPPADLVLCRDCWVHLRNRQIGLCVRNFLKSGARYLLNTTFRKLETNCELRAGEIWRPLNRERPPFVFGATLEVLQEACSEEQECYRDKVFALCSLPDLETIGSA